MYFSCRLVDKRKHGIEWQSYEGLGIKDVYLGAAVKTREFDHFMEKYQLNPEEVLYMGDDIPDYEASAFSRAMYTGTSSVDKVSGYVSSIPGITFTSYSKPKPESNSFRRGELDANITLYFFKLSSISLSF